MNELFAFADKWLGIVIALLAVSLAYRSASAALDGKIGPRGAFQMFLAAAILFGGTIWLVPVALDWGFAKVYAHSKESTISQNILAMSREGLGLIANGVGDGSITVTPPEAGSGLFAEVLDTLGGDESAPASAADPVDDTPPAVADPVVAPAPTTPARGGSPRASPLQRRYGTGCCGPSGQPVKPAHTRAGNAAGQPGVGRANRNG